MTRAHRCSRKVLLPCECFYCCCLRPSVWQVDVYVSDCMFLLSAANISSDICRRPTLSADDFMCGQKQDAADWECRTRRTEKSPDCVLRHQRNKVLKEEINLCGDAAEDTNRRDDDMKIWVLSNTKQQIQTCYKVKETNSFSKKMIKTINTFKTSPEFNRYNKSVHLNYLYFTFTFTSSHLFDALFMYSLLFLISKYTSDILRL